MSSVFRDTISQVLTRRVAFILVTISIYVCMQLRTTSQKEKIDHKRSIDSGKDMKDFGIQLQALLQKELTKGFPEHVVL